MIITEKPPFSYSHIIGMAMLETGRHVTLQQICSWIEMKFAFFRVRKKWNNSIRHNLSLHSCFRKIGRSKEDKGKGGYWELGVDTKKCDRKRIRNRKIFSRMAKSQSKQLQTYSKAPKRSQQYLPKKQDNKYLSGYLKTFLYNSIQCDGEELYTDDNNIRQNNEVMSLNSNNNSISTISFYKRSDAQSVPEPAHEQIEISTKIADKPEFLTDLITDSIHMLDDHVHSHHSGQFPLAPSCYQEYKLGTMIISTSSVEEFAHIHNINSSAFNSLISTCSIKKITETIENTTQQQHHNIKY